MAEIRLPTLNKVFVIGRLTRDPDLRYITEGTPVCSFRLAVNRRYLVPASNEWKDDTTFIDVVAWRKLAERLGETLHKGSPVQVEGRLQSRAWENEAGQKRSIVEIAAERVQNLERVGREEEGGEKAEVSDPASGRDRAERAEGATWSGGERSSSQGSPLAEEAGDDLPF